LPPNEIKKLKAQGLLVREISDQITQFQGKVQQLRAAEKVARNAEPSLPGIATRVIANVIKGRRPLAEEVAEALRVLAPTDLPVSK
jgi:nicotinate-nucleotide pyrophosphorylase